MSGVRLVPSDPSPWLLGVDSLLAIRSDQLGFYEKMKSKHGDHVVLRLGPYKSHLFFHPDHIEALLGKKSQSFIRFRKLTNVVRQWNGNSLLVEEDESWRARRRKVLPAFQTRRLQAYGNEAVAETERLCRELRDSSLTSRVRLDTDAVMAKLTLDIATRTMFGAPPQANGFEIERAIQTLSDTAFSESTSPFTLPDWMPIKRKRQKVWAMRVLDDLVSGLVHSGLRRTRPATDLLASLIEHHDGRFADIRDDVMSLLIAGHETSGALLSWLFACLATHPDSLAAVQDELRRVLGEALPTPEAINALPVLRATINETLRLYPPAYTLFLREATEPVDVLGIQLAKGDLAQIVPFTTQRDPRFFEDPMAFDPTRFLQTQKWPQFSYLPFGAGPRVCIGQNFGLMESCLVAATILQRMAPLPLPALPRPQARFSLRPEGGLPMQWHSI